MTIFVAISNCMAEIGAIGKDQRNVQQGFKYRGIDDVMNALAPCLIKNHVFVTPEVLDERREERTAKSGGNLIYTVLKIKYTFYADDGSSVSATVIGEGMDSGDKSANKAMAIAFKYACFQVFCIPTEEMKDPDAETPEPSEPKKQTRAVAMPPENIPPILEARINTIKSKVIHDIIKKLSLTDDYIKANLKGNYRVDTIEELSETQGDKILIWLNGKVHA
jgi:hypothetical protein